MCPVGGCVDLCLVWRARSPHFSVSLLPSVVVRQKWGEVNRGEKKSERDEISSTHLSMKTSTAMASEGTAGRAPMEDGMPTERHPRTHEVVF